MLARRRSRLPDGTDRQTVNHLLQAIAHQPIIELRRLWQDQFHESSPPTKSRELLRQLFAWRLQTDAIGDLDAASKRTLASIADGLERGVPYEPKFRRSLSVGVVLTREWKGIIHSVTVTDGGFLHLGKNYRSLSDIARTITGTRWSGPRFFGLEQKGQPRRKSALAASATDMTITLS